MDSTAEMGACLWGELSAGRHLGPTLLGWWRERHPHVLGIKGQASSLVRAFHCILGNIQAFSVFSFANGIVSKLYRWQTLLLKI